MDYINNATECPRKAKETQGVRSQKAMGSSRKVDHKG